MATAICVCVGIDIMQSTNLCHSSHQSVVCEREGSSLSNMEVYFVGLMVEEDVIDETEE